jgi:hypothetical protein
MERIQEAAGEHCIKRSFIICKLHKIVPIIKEDGMGHVEYVTEMHSQFNQNV